MSCNCVKIMHVIADRNLQKQSSRLWSLQQHPSAELYRMEATHDVEKAARLQFLESAALILAQTAPETSRHLMSTHLNLLADGALPVSPIHARNVCRACGTLMLSHQDTDIRTKSVKLKSKAKTRHTTSEKALEKMVVYTCGACSRQTRHRVPCPTRTRKSNLALQPISEPLSKASSTDAILVQASSTSKETSRRRQKSKNSGLEALLAKRKAADAQNSSSQFDLFDMMKKD